MPLFDCPNCKGKVSTFAQICPHCFEIVDKAVSSQHRLLPCELRDTHSDAYLGNTSGNLNNSGMSVTYHSGHLICSKTGVQLFDTKFNPNGKIREAASWLNVIGDSLYYRTPTGIYEYDLSCKTTQKIFGGRTDRLTATKDYLFFICKDDEGALYRITRDGKSVKRIVPQKVASYCISEEYVFYTLFSGETFRIGYDFTDKKMIMQHGAIWMCTDKTRLFFSSAFNDSCLCSARMLPEHLRGK